MIITIGRVCHGFYQIRTQRHQLIMTDNTSLKFFWFLPLFLLRLLWDFSLSDNFGVRFEVVYLNKMLNIYYLTKYSQNLSNVN